ncbi:hypothetical protein [Dryocola sp. BD613]
MTRQVLSAKEKFGYGLGGGAYTLLPLMYTVAAKRYYTLRRS